MLGHLRPTERGPEGNVATAGVDIVGRLKPGLSRQTAVAQLAVWETRESNASPIERRASSVTRATNAYNKDFGGWAMLVMVEFPASGCWELTGRYKGQTVSFVVYVDP